MQSEASVGFICDNSFGVETARVVQSLAAEERFDIIPLNKKLIASGMLHQVDAVLAPDGERSVKPGTGLYGGNAVRTKGASAFFTLRFEIGDNRNNR